MAVITLQGEKQIAWTETPIREWRTHAILPMCDSEAIDRYLYLQSNVGNMIISNAQKPIVSIVPFYSDGTTVTPKILYYYADALKPVPMAIAHVETDDTWALFKCIFESVLSVEQLDSLDDEQEIDHIYTDWMTGCDKYLIRNAFGRFLYEELTIFKIF